MHTWFCSFCGGPLRYAGGDEVRGADQGGNSKARDGFACGSCGARFRRVERERMSGVTTVWSLYTSEGAFVRALAGSEVPTASRRLRTYFRRRPVR